MKVDHESKPLWVVARLSRDVVHKAILNKGVIVLTQINSAPALNPNRFVSNLAKFWDQCTIGLTHVILVALHRVFHLTKSYVIDIIVILIGIIVIIVIIDIIIVIIMNLADRAKTKTRQRNEL